MEPTVAEARAALGSRLSHRSLAHADAVAETAAALAERYGTDALAARLAGLLHDWCKDTPHEELLEEATRRGLDITAVDRARPYLLHGPVGAAMLADAFPGLRPEIVRAVEVHTFGATDMSDLDRILYVADMIEPARAHRGVAKVREAVATATLAELVTLAYARSISHIVKGRRPLHSRTLDVWNSLVQAVDGRP